MGNYTLAPIKYKNTLADDVTSRLRDAIVTGQLSPGEKLVEGALAAQMGVSRSPVREALHRLGREGVVIRRTNRTSVVWEPDEDDVDDIIQLRDLLESLAYEVIIEDLTEQDFNQLEAILDQYGQALADIRLVDAIREDRRFHEYICTKSNRPRLIAFWQQIMTQWEVLHFLAARHGLSVIGAEKTMAHHHSILNALRQRDLSRARALLHIHSETSRTILKEALRSARSAR